MRHIDSEYNRPEDTHVFDRPTKERYDVGELSLPGIGLCSVAVYNLENDKEPHFHIYNNDNSFSVAICLDKPEYYDHDGDYPDRLADHQCKAFDEWLKEKNIISLITFGKDKAMTNWKCIRCGWRGLYFESDTEIPRYKPDYSKLNHKK